MIFERARRNYYTTTLASIREPEQPRRVWRSPHPGQRLTLAIIETREHEWLTPVLSNVAHVYGGTEASLRIFHGTHNESYLREILTGWTGVELVSLGKKAIDIPEYNAIMTSPEFWESFASSHVLIFQTDVLLRRRIDEAFFDYDYVGAPWSWRPCVYGNQDNYVGNGGLSLRRVEAMLDIAHVAGPREYNEDVFFAERLDMRNIPSARTASGFAVETIFHPDPCGLHQVWKYLRFDRLRRLLRNVAGAPVPARPDGIVREGLGLVRDFLRPSR